MYVHGSSREQFRPIAQLLTGTVQSIFTRSKRVVIHLSSEVTRSVLDTASFKDNINTFLLEADPIQKVQAKEIRLLQVKLTFAKN